MSAAMNPDEAEKIALVEFFQRRTSGYFVEIGVDEPIKRSQTWPFEQRGWTGLLVEPMQAQFDIIVRARPRSRVERAACAGPEQRGVGKLHLGEFSAHNTLQADADNEGVQYVGLESVPIVTVDDLLEKQPPERVDFLSIDVEGTELDVLRGINLERWRPELILLEDKVHNLSKHCYLAAHGYRLLRRTCFNGWYVPVAHPNRPSLAERCRLFRKYYLAMPPRKLKYWWRSRK
jgi:FkbM family methyltransferase